MPRQGGRARRAELPPRVRRRRDADGALLLPGLAPVPRSDREGVELRRARSSRGDQDALDRVRPDGGRAADRDEVAPDAHGGPPGVLHRRVGRVHRVRHGSVSVPEQAPVRRRADGRPRVARPVPRSVPRRRRVRPRHEAGVRGALGGHDRLRRRRRGVARGWRAVPARSRQGAAAVFRADVAVRGGVDVADRAADAAEGQHDDERGVLERGRGDEGAHRRRGYLSARVVPPVPEEHVRGSV
eukprot:9063-Pelagococcus_subviridis.AAC.1